MVWREMLHAIEFAYYLFNQYPLNIKHRENRKENFPSCFLSISLLSANNKFFWGDDRLDGGSI